MVKAVRSGDLKLLKSMVQRRRGGILRENSQLLLGACRLGNPSIIGYLFIELNEPVILQGGNDTTPLHEAARRVHCRAVEILLKRTPPDILNRADETPLYEAARCGKRPAAALLLKHGARVTMGSKAGETPLDLAMQNNWERLIEILKKSLGRANKRKRIEVDPKGIQCIYAGRDAA